MKKKLSFLPSLQVVLAKEMSRVERLAVHSGCAEEKFMEEAGKNVARVAKEWIQKKGLSKTIVVWIGKGNNGGDGFVAARYLKKEGFDVVAVPFYPKDLCSPLCQKNWNAFVKKKGKVVPCDKKITNNVKPLYIDALLGTGFKGKLTGELKEAIEALNALQASVLSIDIPSGLNGDTGEGETCVKACCTVALGMAKSGFFLEKGWNFVGELFIKEFGLPLEYVKKAKPFAFLPSPKNLKELLPSIERVRHKYGAGYVVGYSGSSQFKGAPKMAGLAALRAGAGIVRVFHREEVGEVPFELIFELWEEKKWRKELKRAKAVFIGPGLGEDLSWLKKNLKNIKVPCVIDADALQKGISFPKLAILTPHRGEMLRLIGKEKGIQESTLLKETQKFVDRKGVICVLKGAPTFIFSSKQKPVIIPRGDPGMATAGSGDVLTGILAAFLAQGLAPLEAAVLGCYLHAVSGEKAAEEKTSFGEIAGDLIELLPQAFLHLSPR